MRASCVLLLLVAGSAFADVDPAFTKLRDSAQPLDSLSAFLDKYVGECAGEDPLANKTCAEKAKAFRSSTNSKKYYMVAGEESVTLSVGSYDEGSGEVTINLTPFFPAGNYALTEGAPKKTDAQGNPLFPLLAITGTAPDGWNGSMLQRMISLRQLRVQVVFTPQDVWSLPKKGGGKLMGVKARLNGVLITVARTGEQVALWTAR